MERKWHGYHLVERSPWPIIGAGGAMTVAIGLVVYMHYRQGGVLVIGGMILMGTMVVWWRDVIREAVYQGHHTTVVKRGLVYGIVLFIVSEVCLFVSLFWAYLHSSVAPAIETGNVWPPTGIMPMVAYGVPLVNTVVLLTSGATVTIAHHGIMGRRKMEAVVGLTLTVILGGIFSGLQWAEYQEAGFTIADGVYGGSFYLTTGAHGMHVLIGSIFLGVCWWRLMRGHYSSGHLMGFEAAAWYWHFVDVVWLCLFVLMYWWGS